MKLVDVLDSKSCVGNHVPVRLRPSAYFLIECKNSRVEPEPVLTSHKMILNHFARQSGIGIFFSYLEKILWSRTGAGSYLSQNDTQSFCSAEWHRHIFFIFRKDIMESNRIPVLTSRKMILNHFSRQSGHRHIFSYLEKILWSRTEKLYNSIFI